MELCIQDPKYPNSYSLHEALLRESGKSIQGGGVYAFVSVGGVKLFLESNIFNDMLQRGNFTIIVGIDEITNEKTIIKLKELEDKNLGKLKIYAFLNDASNSLFHPKFCWFKHNQGGSLITGSGNLTEKGLRKNREIFNIIELNDEDLQVVINQWNEWLEYNRLLLRPLDDKKVLEKARFNQRMQHLKARVKSDRQKRKNNKEEHDEKSPFEVNIYSKNIEIDDFEAWQYQDSDDVLICELSKNGDRFRQANFDKDSFYNFFGASNSDRTRITVFRAIYNNGTLGEIEQRPAVRVASQNYRFELDALSGIRYPKLGKPIGIFIRIMTRMILYTVVMPDNEKYPRLQEFLYKNSSVTRADRMKRLNTNVKSLKENCGELTICKL